MTLPPPRLRWAHARVLRHWLAAAACGLCVTAAIQAEDASPEVKAKVGEFMKKVVKLQRKHLDERLSTEIEDITKATDLGPEGVKALQAAAVSAEDAAQAELTAKGVEDLPKQYARGGQTIDSLERPEIVEMFAGSDFNAMGIRYTQALDQSVWKDALARVLSPAQAARWQKVRDERDTAVTKEFNDFLDKQVDQIRTSLSSPVFTKSTEIIDALNLPKDRADALTALAKKAIDASMAAWRREALKTFLDNDESTRKRLLRGRQFYCPPKEEDAPDNQPVWTQGVAQALNDEERAKLQASHGTQRKRRTHALSLLMVTLLDDKVAFTAAQRPRIEPIAERLVDKVEEFYPQADSNNEYFTLNPISFYKAAGAAKAEEMRPILDDLQWNRWQEVRHEKMPGNDDEEEDNQRATPTPKPADTIEEPEDVERFVSDYLQGKVAAQHREIDATMLLQAEDATRVANLPPATAARLRTAAHGAAEFALATWSASLEQSVRGQVQGATRETVRQRLGNGNRYYYGQANTRDQPFWKEVVKTELTKAQQDAWQVERDARAQYNDDAIAQFLLAEFDRSFFLNAQQWERLLPLVSKALHEYRPEMTQMFSYNSPQWYLTSYYMFLPLHAIPEAEIKAVIGQERYDHWAESNGYRYSVQYWTNIKQSHDQRTKEEKP